MSAMDMIIAERRRHQDVEGWTAEHDDEHTDGSLFEAAMCYVTFDPEKQNPNIAPRGWPSSWGDMWFKPRSRLENLVRAGALCLAESDRLKRRNDLGLLFQRRHPEARPVAVHGEWKVPSHLQRKLDLIIAEMEDACPGHVASDAEPKVCGRCGIHIDSLRPD